MPPETVPMLVTRGVTCLAANSFGSRLMVGYEGGFLRLFDLWPLQEDGWKCFDRPLAEWRAHLTRFGVSSVELMTLSSGTELFLTAGGFEVKMWSVEGHFIGMFGQGGPWPMLLHGTAPGAVATAASRQAEDIIQGFSAGERRGSESGGLASPTRRAVGHGDVARAGSSSSAWSPQSPKGKHGATGGGASPHAPAPASSAAAGLCSAFHFGWTRAPLRPGSMRPPGSMVPPLAASLLAAAASFASPSRASGALSPNPASFRAGTPAAGAGAAEAGVSPTAAPGSPTRSPGASGRRPVGGLPAATAVAPTQAPETPSGGEDGMDLSTFDRRGSSLHILASRRHSALMAASMRFRTGSAASGSPSVDDEVPAPRSQFLRARVEDRATVDATVVAVERSMLRTNSTGALRSTVPAAAALPSGHASLTGIGGSSFVVPAGSGDADGSLDGQPFVPGAVRRRRSSIEKRPDLLARVHSTVRMVASPVSTEEGGDAPAAAAAGGGSGARPPYRTIPGKATLVDEGDGAGDGAAVDVTSASDADVWLTAQPPITLSTVNQELRHQRRRHGERLGHTEAAAAALPSYAQNPFTYAGAGRWISKKELPAGAAATPPPTAASAGSGRA
jgi:hypothetical protein